MADVDPNEEHEPVKHRTRIVCSCGDFNCASLDALPITTI